MNEEKIEKIKDEAQASWYAMPKEERQFANSVDYLCGYVDGAEAEASKALPLLEALEKVLNETDAIGVNNLNYAHELFNKINTICQQAITNYKK